MLSWQLQDAQIGARQTAYQIQIASSTELLTAGKPDIWDSGRVESDQSAGVSYAGPALVPEKRYFWRVKVWDKDGKPYPASDASWWETGLLEAKEWRGKWIGREEHEFKRVREADAAWVTNPKVENFQASGGTHHDFRLVFEVSKTVKIADLFVTGENTAAAWLNGKEVLNARRPDAYERHAVHRNDGWLRRSICNRREGLEVGAERDGRMVYTAIR